MNFCNKIFNGIGTVFFFIERHRFDANIDNNLYLKSMNIDELSKAIARAIVPFIEHTKFHEAYNESSYSNGRGYILRKITALPLALYEVAFKAVIVSAVLGVLRPPTYLLIFLIDISKTVYTDLKKEDISLPLKIIEFIFMEILAILILTTFTIGLAVVDILGNSICHLIRALGYLLTIYKDELGTRYIHYAQIAQCFDFISYGSRIEIPLLKVANILNKFREMNKNLSELDLKKLDLIYLTYWTDTKDPCEKIETFTKNWYEDSYKNWTATLTAEQVFKQFYDFSNYLINDNHKSKIFETLSSILNKDNVLYLDDENSKKIKELYVKVTAQIYDKLTSTRWEKIFKNDDKIKISKPSYSFEWSVFCDKLFDRTKILTTDTDLNKKISFEIISNLFKSLTTVNKSLLLNFLEINGHIYDNETIIEPSELKDRHLYLFTAEHKKSPYTEKEVFIHLLPEHPKWLLEKKKIKESWKIFVKSLKQKFPKIRLPKDILLNIFARDVLNTFAGSQNFNESDINHLALAMKNLK